MKSIQFLALATLAGTALSDLALDFDENTTMVDVVSSIEDCSWSCWDKAVAASGCGSTDFECFCKDRGIGLLPSDTFRTTLELNKPSEDDLSKAKEMVNNKVAAGGKAGSDEKPKKDEQGEKKDDSNKGEKKDGESSGVRVAANLALAAAAFGAHLLA
ncbi:hypothetical protein K4F52_005682 [Lecanicillium sp. MT-2017a]|nr:hypothetical protein K4F52_005682 [Lecanicillium sp. MT-2017a]